MWIERTNKVIDVPGIFILLDNPITIGAYSFLPSMHKFAVWIHKKRYTATFLKNTILTGVKCTFSITNDLSIIKYCGRVSGRNVNKLSVVKTTILDGYQFVSDSETVVMLTIEQVISVHDFYLVVCHTNKILNFREGGQHWVEI